MEHWAPETAITAEEAERMRRSMAMLKSDGPSWMTAGRVWQILDALVKALNHLKVLRRDAEKVPPHPDG